MRTRNEKAQTRLAFGDGGGEHRLRVNAGLEQQFRYARHAGRRPEDHGNDRRHARRAGRDPARRAERAETRRAVVQARNPFRFGDQHTQCGERRGRIGRRDADAEHESG